MGEATAHNGASLIVGGSVTVAGAILFSNLVGGGSSRVVAAGVGVTAVFELAYKNNFKGLKDGLDWVGEQIDSVGDAIMGDLDAINPFS